MLYTAAGIVADGDVDDDADGDRCGVNVQTGRARKGSGSTVFQNCGPQSLNMRFPTWKVGSTPFYSAPSCVLVAFFCRISMCARLAS
jgi:hypothetical protein